MRAGARVAFAVLCTAPGAAGARATEAPLKFKILPVRSSVRFDARATGHTVHGVTQQVSGEVVFDPEDLAKNARVTLQVQAATLNTGNKVRDRKMRESHLETERHPLIGFRSSKVEAIAPSLREGETQEMNVSGTLSLHGVDRNIVFPVKAVRRGGDLLVSGETTLRMSDYGIPVPGFLFVKVQDQVKVMFEVVAAPDGTGS